MRHHTTSCNHKYDENNMCTTRAEIKEVMDESAAKLVTEVSLLKARYDEYQRDLKRHMDEESKWYEELKRTQEAFNQLKQQLSEFERSRDAVHYTMRKEIAEEIHRDDREERDRLEKTFASHVDSKISAVRTSLLQWIGVGGVVAVGSIVFYFGGLGEQVANHEQQIIDLKGETVSYVDQQNKAQDDRIARIEEVVKEGFVELKEEIRAIK